MFKRGGADPVGKEKQKEEWEICGSAPGENEQWKENEDLFSRINGEDFRIERKPKGEGESALIRIPR